MRIQFNKYHGTGNDFILIDDRQENFIKDHKLIEKLCNRRFGIGADGLILIRDHSDLDFKMEYFNSNGYEGSMCGNGGRCAVHFTKTINLISTRAEFETIDGIHNASIDNELVKLSMNPVNTIKESKKILLLDIGSPHAVIFKENIENIDIIKEGKLIRYDETLSNNGVNVNFVQIMDENNIYIRTYERGVENETLSCGTGVVASSLAAYIKLGLQGIYKEFYIKTPGGELKVTFSIKDKRKFRNIFLMGPAIFVYSGNIFI